jgi:uncharacterized membrane protein
MTNRILGLAAALALGLGSAGCNNSPQGGNPGTADSFKVTAPTMATSLKQGEKETVTMNVTRGTEFKKTVDIKADAPSGLKAVLVTTKVSPSDPAAVSMTVEATKTCPLGDHIVKVTATPESGAATSVDVKVTVKEGPKS